MKIKLFAIAVLLLNIQQALEEKSDNLQTTAPFQISEKKKPSSRVPASLPGETFVAKIQTPVATGDLELDEEMTVKLVPKQN